MTHFEKMRVDQLLKAVDACNFGEAELRKLEEEMHDRVVQKMMKKELEVMHGGKAYGRSDAGSKRKDTPSKSTAKRRLCLSGKLYTATGTRKRLETVSSDRKESKRS